MSNDTKTTREDKFGLDRIVFFSDAVIAIAITLLVIELKIPHLEHSMVSSELGHSILEMWPEFLGYVVSFMVIAMYWVAHHSIFRNIINYNKKLIYINILFLMCVAFMPFVTNLLFNYPAVMISVVMYAGLVTLIGLAIIWIWQYAKKNNLIYDDVDKKEIKRISIGLIYSPIVFGISIIIALFSPRIAMYSWIVLMPLYIVANRNRK